jgi:hypothetical protein
LGIILLVCTILLLGVLARRENENAGSAHTQEEGAGTKMNVVAAPWNEKEPGPAPTSAAGIKWTVENPVKRAMGEWIELGRKLRGASDEEILSLMGSVETYLEVKLNNETPPSTHYDYRAYVRGYAMSILEAARAELGKRNSKRPG